MKDKWILEIAGDEPQEDERCLVQMAGNHFEIAKYRQGKWKLGEITIEVERWAKLPTEGGGNDV